MSEPSIVLLAEEAGATFTDAGNCDIDDATDIRPDEPFSTTFSSSEQLRGFRQRLETEFAKELVQQANTEGIGMMLNYLNQISRRVWEAPPAEI